MYTATALVGRAAITEEHRKLLLEDEAPNGLVLGLLARLEAQKREPVCLFSVEKAGKIAGLALQTHAERFLILSWMSDRAIPTLVAAAAAQKLSFPGVVGPEPAGNAFARLWSERSEVGARLAMPQGIFKLTKLADVPMPAGSFRLASDADLDLTSAWYAAFTREADLPANERANPDEARIFAGTLTKAGTLYVWCDENGDAVAMANRARETPGGSCLNLVYTPRDKRGRGYAGAVCWHLSKKILDEGRFAFLYTDLRNPVSNGLYKKLGYKAVGDQGSYAFGKEAPGE